MQNNIDSWPNTMKDKIRLSPTKSNSSLQSTADHPKKTKVTLHIQKQEVSTQRTIQEVAAQTPKAKKEALNLITSKDQILHKYPDVFEGIGTFPGPSYHIQNNPSETPKQTPC